MAIIYYFGSIPVEREEALERLALGQLTAFDPLVSTKSNKVNFNEGTVDSFEILDNSSLDLPEFQPIGINKPLSIEILCAYSGNAPKTLFGGKKDMLIVSAVKAYNTFDAKPRAINMVKKKAENFKILNFSAIEDGSPIVYYSGAQDINTLFFTFEMVADTFSKETFDLISNLFSTAAGLPIFAPKAPFLLAGSLISGVVGKLGNTFLESKPFLIEDDSIRFDTAGLEISKAKQLVICNEKDKSELKQFKPGLYENGTGEKKPCLINRVNNQPYKGNAPYILVNIDGRNRPELENFAPKIATASILEKYYGAADRGSQTTEIIETALTLYSDLNFQNKGKKLENEIRKMTEGSPEFIKANELLEAYKKNINFDQFKL